MIWAQILAEVGNKPPGKGKVVGAVKWAMCTLGEDQLSFKATAAMFGCIPDYKEPSPGLDSTIPTEFKGSAMESDVLSAKTVIFKNIVKLTYFRLNSHIVVNNHNCLLLIY